MSLLPEEKKEEPLFPQFSDKTIPLRKRMLEGVVTFVEALVIMVLIYLSGLALCSLMGKWLGGCVC